MKLSKSSILITFLFAIQLCRAQHPIRTMTNQDVFKHTKYFTFENETITGSGKTMLTQIAKKSQFVIIGETHGSSQTSNLVSAWLPELNKQGFDYFACEVGPHSANVLSRLSTPAQSTEENLRKFHQQYYVEAFDDGTIPFFEGKEDARFLQVAAELDMKLWGLDQEYYYSILHLTEELVNTAINSSNYSQIVATKKKVNETLYAFYIKEDTSTTSFDATKAILEDQSVNDFFNLFNQESQAAQSIIKDIKISFDIYINWRRGSHADRVSYMRKNLANEINKAKSKNGELPKVFLKFGQVHASKTISNEAYDIGHQLQEIACQSGLQAVNIAIVRRYVLHNGNSVDLLKQSGSRYGKNVSLLSVGKQNEAAIINLSNIRCDLRKGNYSLPQDGDYHRIKKMLDGFDYIIVLPMDQPSERLF